MADGAKQTKPKEVPAKDDDSVPTESEDLLDDGDIIGGRFFIVNISFSFSFLYLLRITF